MSNVKLELTVGMFELKDCKEVVAPDGTIIRELISPTNQKVSVGYSLAHGTLKPGQHQKEHTLYKASEVYYFLSGEGIIHVGDENSGVVRHEVGPGSIVFVGKGQKQWLENISALNELNFLCLVEPYWRREFEE